MLLAGDIGGTKTNLAIYSPQAGPFAPIAKGTYPSANYHSLEELVDEFLSQVNLQVERASFGVAGPVAGNLALKVGATGGLYLGGGIPRRIVSSLESEAFPSPFWKKGK